MNKRYALNISQTVAPWKDRFTKAVNAIMRKGIPETQRDFYPDYIRDEGRHDDFPDYWVQIINASPLASAANRRRTQFIAGKGFVQENIGSRKINDEQTFHELHDKLMQDFGLWERFAIKVITNRSGNVISLSHMPAEQIRYEWPHKGSGKIEGCWCMPYLNSTEDKALDSYWLPLYKPGQTPKDTREQMQEAIRKNSFNRNGTEKQGEYYGHIIFYNKTSPINRVYSRPAAYAAEKDILADGRVSQSIERITANSFLSPGALAIPGDPNEGAYQEGLPESAYKTKGDIINEQLSESMAGSPNAGAITVFWTGPGEATPEFIPFQQSNLHELFTATDNMLTQRIAIAFMVPQVLLGVRQPGQLGENQQIRSAIQYANQSTAAERKMIQKLYSDLLRDIRGFNTRNGVEIMPIQDWSDIPDSIFNGLTAAQKDAYLQEAYGIEPDPEGRTPIAMPQQQTPQQNADNPSPDNPPNNGSTN